MRNFGCAVSSFVALGGDTAQMIPLRSIILQHDGCGEVL